MYYNIFGLLYLGCLLFSELSASSEYFTCLFAVFHVKKHAQINSPQKAERNKISACIIGISFLVNWYNYFLVV